MKREKRRLMKREKRSVFKSAGPSGLEVHL
jgi:hypothetical protein